MCSFWVHLSFLIPGKPDHSRLTVGFAAISKQSRTSKRPNFNNIKKPCQILLLDRDKTKNKHYEQTLSKTQLYFLSEVMTYSGNKFNE